MNKDFIEEDYYKFIVGRPHVFILGAGATIAAIPNGDKNGKKSTVMNGFIDNLGLREFLNEYNFIPKSENIEDLYSEIHNNTEYKELVEVLEDKIIDYFSQLEIPNNPTVYDYLLLSLRSKDYIFSFNWDDLLIQAYQRVWKITQDLPKLGFLHGNINLGICPNCKSIETLRHIRCRKCGTFLNRPKILFPVTKKDYASDYYIKNCWHTFLEVLSQSTIVTIFGYSAPKSDYLAMKAMENAFSSNYRRLDQIEVIDIRDESYLYDTWQSFREPTNDHFKIRRSLFESFISEFPRRSVEGYWKRNFSNWWGESSIKLKECNDFDELKTLFNPLLEQEKKGLYLI